jgi:undecaprenyl-diphosphatase
MLADSSKTWMDEKLLFLINRNWSAPWLDRVMALASSFDVWLPIIVIVVLALLIRGSFKMRACILTAALIVGINDGVVARTLKRVVDRPRPHETHNDVRMVDFQKAKPRVLAVFRPMKVEMSRASLEDVEGRSFPSSHTINTCSVAVVGMMFFGLRAWWLTAIAALVGVSRIYVGAHWPSDILVSVFIGCGSTLLLLAVVKVIWNRFGGRVLPKMHHEHPQLFTA